jgi:hypothetical protein
MSDSYVCASCGRVLVVTSPSELEVEALREAWNGALRDVSDRGSIIDRLSAEVEALRLDLLSMSRLNVDRLDKAKKAEARALAADSLLAEAVGALKAEVALLRAWARESREGGWSTHQVDPMNRRADDLGAVLAKIEGTK